MYKIEFIRRLDGQAEALALEAISLVGGKLDQTIQRATELFRSIDTVPRPDGFRIWDDDGQVVHEFYDVQKA